MHWMLGAGGRTHGGVTQAAAWDPAQYLRWSDHRLRPAVDLLQRVPLASPARVVDLGCGTGNVTALLRGRWPGARVTGVDASATMLERARASDPGVDWRQADVAAWAPPAPGDGLFSNATPHWIDDHAAPSARPSRARIDRAWRARIRRARTGRRCFRSAGCSSWRDAERRRLDRFGAGR